eukprot:c18623_g1_i4.p2 GENE.c18623_g1_i4~~c18623_g1_i4.p2  ORF type:complete len:132 (+),score=29.56 c18623_g1_i4:835-1230(+)
MEVRRWLLLTEKRRIRTFVIGITLLSIALRKASFDAWVFLVVFLNLWAVYFIINTRRLVIGMASKMLRRRRIKFVDRCKFKVNKIFPSGMRGTRDHVNPLTLRLIFETPLPVQDLYELELGDDDEDVPANQ